MRKCKYLVLVLMTTAFLGSCDDHSPSAARNPKPTMSSETKSERAKKLQAAVVDGCGWVPVVSTLISIIPAVSAAGPSFDKLAKAICDKAKAAPASASTSGYVSITVDGSNIRGRFLEPGEKFKP